MWMSSGAAPALLRGQDDRDRDLEAIGRAKPFRTSIGGSAPEAVTPRSKCYEVPTCIGTTATPAEPAAA
jgi:hypothetical protein